jgi:sugar phosphate isomerase/epimerase
MDPAAELRKISYKIVYTTLADYKPVNRNHYLPNLVNYEKDIPLMRACPMGDGIIDNKTFLKILKTIGYDGFVAYEMCSDLEGGGSMKNLDYCARHFLDFMNKT